MKHKKIELNGAEVKMLRLLVRCYEDSGEESFDRIIQKLRPKIEKAKYIDLWEVAE